MDTPLVSVLVPVYNDAAYLPDTLGYALGQTMEEIEVVCVNDGSTDGTADVLADRAARDSRLRVVTQPENRGTLSARRRCVEEARGEYALFMDADDILSPHACRTACDLIRQYETDVLWFTSRIEHYDAQGVLTGGETRPPRQDTVDRTLTGDELLHLCTGRGLNVTALWNRMYRTETLRRAFTYADDFYCSAGEDLYLSFCIGLSARSFRGAVTEPLYTYRLESQYRSQAARIREMEDRPAQPEQRRGLFRRGQD